jgi:hypothetical protein
VPLNCTYIGVSGYCKKKERQRIMKQILIIVGLVISGVVCGQQAKTTDFLTEITKYDISHLWTLNKFQVENDTIIVERQEPLGYIGESFQRFYIHFISAIQNPTDKLKYFIYGKTRVKENICSFQGEIVIKEVRIYAEGDLPPLKQGFVKGTYEFYEYSKQKGAGKLVGDFTTNFYIDEKGNFKYDALMFVADGFDNNQFEGIWTSYKSNESRKCNWGDYRIPDSKELDCGAGEFSVVDKYASNGWIPYILEHMMNKKDISNSPEFPDSNDKWWK